MRYGVRKEEVFAGAGSFGLDEDEFILDAEWRGTNRLVIAVASPLDECGVCGCVEPCEHGCCGGGD